PALEASPEGLRREPAEDTGKGVGRRRAVGQRQKPPEPGQPLSRENADVFPGVAIPDNRTDGDDDDVQQLMSQTPPNAGVLELAKMPLDRCRAGDDHDSLRDPGEGPEES